jgi:CubicO group peptidase (beta-lactamase class C family)
MPNENSKSAWESVVEATQNAMETHGIPGVAVGLIHNGQQHSIGLGITNFDHPLTVTSDTLFQIGSITKTYTALATMILVDRGLLDLDATVISYLPNFQLADANVAKNVTLRHLLTDSGGWQGDYFNDFGWGDNALELMCNELKKLPQITALGEHYSYCNSGFYILGRVIEIITKQTFEAALTNLVLKPLGLHKSYLFPHDVMTHSFVVGHDKDDAGKITVKRPWPIGRAAHPAGCIVCSINDLMRYAAFWFGDGLLEDDSRLLSSESMQLMQTPFLLTGGVTHVCLGWMQAETHGIKRISHSGGTIGQICNLIIAPKQRFAIGVVTNSSHGGHALGAAVPAAFRDCLNITIPVKTPLTLQPEILASYAGFYEEGLCDITIACTTTGLQLSLHPKGGFPLSDSPADSAPPAASIEMYAADSFFIADGEMKGSIGDFVRDVSGEIHGIRLYGRLKKRKTLQ